MSDLITFSTVLAGAGSGILVPFVNKLLGPAADEAGLIVADHMRFYRVEKQINLLGKTKEMLKKAGVGTKQVALKTLLPLMEDASLEEDEGLSDKWAALLANAADATNRVAIKPAFREILRQLSSDEAVFLDFLFNHMLPYSHLTSLPPAEKKLRMVDGIMTSKNLKENYAHLHPTVLNVESMIDNLLRNRILIPAQIPPNMVMNPEIVEPKTLAGSFKTPTDVLFFTSLGYDFMVACLPPEPVGDSSLKAYPTI